MGCHSPILHSAHRFETDLGGFQALSQHGLLGKSDTQTWEVPWGCSVPPTSSPPGLQCCGDPLTGSFTPGLKGGPLQARVGFGDGGSALSLPHSLCSS